MMPFIIALCIIFILVFAALWLSLKGEKSKKKFSAIWAILGIFVASYFFWFMQVLPLKMLFRYKHPPLPKKNSPMAS